MPSHGYATTGGDLAAYKGRCAELCNVLRLSSLLLLLLLLISMGDCAYGRAAPATAYKAPSSALDMAGANGGMRHHGGGGGGGGGDVGLAGAPGTGLAVSGGGSDMPVASQVLLTQLLLAANNNNNNNDADNGDASAFYSQMHSKYPRRPNYIAKWPGLRDLLLTPGDYEENGAGGNGLESSEIVNLRFIERLHQLADNSAMEMFEDARDESRNQLSVSSVIPDQQRASQLQGYGGGGGGGDGRENQVVEGRGPFKQHGTKKNVQYRKQYMSPCHFKICNMGRKRNALVLGDY